MDVLFTAKRCMFNDVWGYRFVQYDGNGSKICSQFIPKDAFEDFLCAAGIDINDIKIEH